MTNECKHDRLNIIVRDFGVFDEKERQYDLEKDGKYHPDGDWGEWSSKDGHPEKVVHDIQCLDGCGEYFYEDGSWRIEEDHPMYSIVEALMLKTQEEEN